MSNNNSVILHGSMLVGATMRYNSAGKSNGSRIAFNQEYTAGDIKKALKERNPSLKGKKLTAEVDRVLRGDHKLGKALLAATISTLDSMGFVPTVGNINKAGTKATLTLERPTVVFTSKEITSASKSLSDDELAATMANLQAEAQARAQAKNTVTVSSTTTEQPKDEQAIKA